MTENDKSRMTLIIPKDLRDAAEELAKSRFMSLTGLILAALKKEVEAK